MKLNDNEKEQLRSLIYNPQWHVISRAVEIYCQGVLDNSPIRDSEYETLKAVFEKEFKAQGVREFIQGLQEQIQ